MIVFVMELFILGVLFSNLFINRLPALFLGLIAPLLGLITFVFNVLGLLLFHVQVTSMAVVLITAAEIILLAIYQCFILKTKFNIREPLYAIELLVGVVFTAALLFFKSNIFTFLSNDSIYMEVMAQNILDTGLSKWYFASPAGMGLFVPTSQTIGLLFGYGYTWFIQPLFSLIFFALFTYFCVIHLNKRKMSWWMIAGILVLVYGVLLTSNIFLASTVYIHTNFDSGLFIFLTVMTLVVHREDKNSNWLFFTGLFMTVVGFLRVENILFNFVIIIVFMIEDSITHKEMIFTFVPPLGIHFLWYMLVFRMKTNSYSDQLSPEMFIIVLAIILLMIGLLIFSNQKLIRKILTQLLPKILLYGLAAVVVLLLIVEPGQTIHNLLVNLANMFVTGNWWSTWWFVAVWAIALVILRIHIPDEKSYLFLITTFFTMVLLLGAFRDPYHINFSDSADRMMIHILPVVMFYLIEKTSFWYEQSKLPVSASSD